MTRFFYSLSILIFSLHTTIAHAKLADCDKTKPLINWNNCYAGFKWDNGESYFGDWNRNLRHGYGTQEWPDGQRYSGYWENNNRTGTGEQIWPDGRRYLGKWKDNKRHGDGAVWFPNGNFFQGEYKFGKKTGLGYYRYKNTGDVYVGGFLENLYHGLGLTIFNNGDADVCRYIKNEATNCSGSNVNDVYPVLKNKFDSLSIKSRKELQNNLRKDKWYLATIDGKWGQQTLLALARYSNANFKSNELSNQKLIGKVINSLISINGSKTIVYSGGIKYVGETLDGKPNGYGTYYLKDGTISYEGAVKNGQPHGFGTKYFLDETYTGEFEDGKMHGKGKLIESNGTSHEGYYVNDTFHGQGTMIYSNGDSFVGEFKFSKVDGIGKFIKLGDYTYKGAFVENLFEGQGILNYDNGDKYVGGFKEGKYNGEGTLTFASGEISSGNWKDGELVKSEAQQTETAFKQTKVALLIGNSKYEYTTHLKNPSNDVVLLKSQLLNLGFSVTTLLDATRMQMTDKILEFGQKTEEADISLLFYAGHSIEAQGLNYLLPIDAEILSENALEPKAVSLNWVLKQTKPTKLISIALLDACRNNPFADRMYKTKTRSVASRGLAKVKVEGNQFIGFSAAPGQVALDGTGNNSPYTKALVKYIPSKEEISYMFRKIKTEVLKTTSGEQVPYVENNLGAELIYLYK